MRYAILADIHGNLAAFQAVLKDLQEKDGFDKIICLGDVVGYGPEPCECIEQLRRFDHECVAGNHDLASINKINTFDFNVCAAQALEWTGKQLSPEDVRYLDSLPELFQDTRLTAVHGSPRDPVNEYLLSIRAAEENFEHFNTDICFVGHSHIPVIFEELDDAVSLQEFYSSNIYQIRKNRLIINPGGLGQPRDRDPRAGYALYDTEMNTVTLFRVEYDIELTQKKMKEAGLPGFLISRLSSGW